MSSDDRPGNQLNDRGRLKLLPSNGYITGLPDPARLRVVLVFDVVLWVLWMLWALPLLRDTDNSLSSRSPASSEVIKIRVIIKVIHMFFMLYEIL